MDLNIEKIFLTITNSLKHCWNSIGCILKPNLDLLLPTHDLLHLGGQARDEGHGAPQEQENDDKGFVGEDLLEG